MTETSSCAFDSSAYFFTYSAYPPYEQTVLNTSSIVLAEAFSIVVCLAGSAFFSGSETALTSLSRAQAQQLYEDEGMVSLKMWIEKPIHVLTAILIGNNIFNITASALATDLADRLLRDTAAANWAIPVAVGIMTFLLLTFGEITPKAIAKRLYKRWASRSMTVMKLPLFLFKIPTLFFTRMTRAMMRAMGNDPTQVVPNVTAEEIEYMINLGSREGTFTEDRGRMLQSVFSFKDTIVRDIMIPRTEMVSINTDMSMREIADAFVDCGHSRLPIYEGGIDNIIGIFYAKDLLEHAFKDTIDSLDVHEMLRKTFFVPGTKNVSDLMEDFQRQRTHLAIVVDEFGGTDGLVTLEDIVEEFFGEIQDEYDTEPDMVVELSEDLFEVPGRASIYEVENFFNIKFPHNSNYETVGGFLMDSCGAVPLTGYEMEWGPLTFTVLDADETHVISTQVARDPYYVENHEMMDVLS